MTGRVRVLQVIQNLNYGGMERVLTDIVTHLDPERFESEILTLQYRGRYAREVAEKARFHDGPPQAALSLLYPRNLTTTLKKIRPDVVHAHSGVWYKSALASRLAGVPWTVYTEHGRASPDPLRSRIIDRMAGSRTDVVVAVSRQLEEHLRRKVLAPAVRIEMIPNGIDTNRFQPRPDDGSLRRELSLSSDVPVLLSIGRLEPIKGYDILVKAAANAKERIPDRPWVLLVAGDGSQAASLARLTAEYGLADNVRWLGWRDDVDRLHASAFAFVLGSRSEGTSISLLESMAAGLCPIVTDVGGNRAVLGDALGHRVAEPVKPADLGARIASAVQDFGSAVRDGAVARQRVEREYSVGRMVRAYERIYTERTG